MIDKIFSYTAANSLPLKLFLNQNLLDSLIHRGTIIPVHIQLNPTNFCNRTCSFCSCNERDRDFELSADKIKAMFVTFKDLGAQSITITGGGEPCLHRGINDIVRCISEMDIEIGLVTNGYFLENLKTLDKLTWCRISGSDEDELPKDLALEVERANIDWAFSYVVTEDFAIDNLCNYIRFAAEHNFTHVRVVPDLLNVDSIDIKEIEQAVRGKTDDSLVIYQERKHHEIGCRPCYISLLKPVIGADGNLYPCCGTQYAEEAPSLDYGPTMQMPTNDIERIYKDQLYFKGGCARCYYNNYNEILKTLLFGTITHEKFI